MRPKSAQPKLRTEKRRLPVATQVLNTQHKRTGMQK